MTDNDPDLKEVIKEAIEAYLTFLLKRYQMGIDPDSCKNLFLNSLGEDPEFLNNKILIRCAGRALGEFDNILKDPEKVKQIQA